MIRKSEIIRIRVYLAACTTTAQARSRRLYASVVEPLDLRNSHLSAYAGALKDDKDDFRRFYDWFKEREDEELEMMQRVSNFHADRELESVRQAVICVVGKGYGRLRVQRKMNEFIIDKEGGELSNSQLSDGERTIILLAGDIARRLALATLGSDFHGDPFMGYGTILSAGSNSTLFITYKSNCANS